MFVLDGTPVFLGCSGTDEQVPAERVRESAAVFRSLGTDVTERMYGGGHEVTDDEFEVVGGLVESLLAST